MRSPAHALEQFPPRSISFLYNKLFIILCVAAFLPMLSLQKQTFTVIRKAWRDERSGSQRSNRVRLQGDTKGNCMCFFLYN